MRNMNIQLKQRQQHMYKTWWLWGILGLAIRIWLIEYFEWDNNIYQGKFNPVTDLDYKVYLDASLYDNPYKRHTYRYSPLLALIMSPSYSIDQNFGKYVLAVFDLFASYFFFKIFADRKGENNVKGGMVLSLCLFLNPFVIYISIRGSCEGITFLLISTFLYFYFGGQAHGNMNPEERRTKGIVNLQPNRLKRYISYAIYGLLVHFRIFPIIILPTLIMYQFYSVKEGRWRHLFKYLLQFGLISGGVFLAISVYFYSLYGYDFLHENYFYHLTRRDNRHSRSIFFYQFYLNYEADSIAKSLWRIICRSLPQAITIAFFSFYLIRKRSLFYCIGFLMVNFILLNKVLTDQYYYWLFSFIYLVIPEAQLYQQQKWLKLCWRVYVPQFLCVIPVAGWIFIANKLGNPKQWYLVHLWGFNVFALVSQIIILTSGPLNLLAKKKVPSIKNQKSAKQTKLLKND